MQWLQHLYEMDNHCTIVTTFIYLTVTVLFHCLGGVLYRHEPVSVGIPAGRQSGNPRSDSAEGAGLQGQN